MKITDNIQYLKGIGAGRAKLFREMGIETIEDLIRYFPRRHLDFSRLQPIRDANEGDLVTIAGNITRVNSGSGFRKAEKVEAYLHDGSGGIFLVWFNAPHMKETLLRNGTGVFSGKVTLFQGKKQLVNPTLQLDGNMGTTAGGILPVYMVPSNFSQNQLRVILKTALDECAEEKIEDALQDYYEEFGFTDIKTAFRQIHFPGDDAQFENARARFVMEEFLFFQLAILLFKKKVEDEQSYAKLKLTDTIDKRIRALFPFCLTAAQDSVLRDIESDLSCGKRVNRLIQGDVGSGKTAIAMYFLLLVVANKMQGVLVAPTEVLATQHYLNFKTLLKNTHVRIGFLIGSQTKKERQGEVEAIRGGQVDIIIGTHAVFSDTIDFKNLGGVVIDEQHRFGVVQRAKLIGKGFNPHVLVMTATPIPRTLSLTLYGDLEASIIDSLPPGRSPIRTLIAHDSQRRRAYATILQELKKSHQAYLVCPLIEESEELDYQSAIQLFESIKQGVFEDYTVGLLHGRMSVKEKQEIMNQFREGTLHVLVCTQVIEVGVDNPNATVILIDSAERFGLAQLHQLRGRVGRGQAPSTCLLVTPHKSGTAFERLRVLEGTNDGFKIAEADLEIRGTGEYFGLRQSGLPEFKTGHPLKDFPIMVKARQKAREIVENGSLKKQWIQQIEKRYQGRLQWGGIS